MEDEAKAVRLCDWPATDLDSLVATVPRWGLINYPLAATHHEVTGQFATDGQAGWFELTIHRTDSDF